ncbi:mannonate dehydratase [Parapedobacter koreensis]|uniref:mannonate dehydratase n=1 Tax=Parapedobacter koreensis TaxID=332977 RepID=A0A1H7SBZ5_9SPHI|nr:mannonate dehydratase [Parapedobacter koreensis]SEL69878.1 mannonate dehydratase [Parapedobacter koreensis]
MKDNRRNFIKKSTALVTATAAGIGLLKTGSATRRERQQLAETVKDAGMEMSEAYFWGPDERRVALAKQLNVFGAVAGVNPRVAGLEQAVPWKYETIKAVKAAWAKLGLNFNVVEGPPALGNKTKLGLEGRDEEIDNFIAFMKNLKRTGIDIICYNWMPVISWARTQNDWPGRGGALMTAFDYQDVKDLPLTEFGEVSKDTLWKNLAYFLKAVVPEAEKIEMKLAMHPDDPQVDSIRGISRIMNSVDNFRKMADIVQSPYNGITMCQGNFALMGVDIPALIREFGQRDLIHFVHFRNVQDLSGQVPSTKFVETFHDEGMIDMYAAMQAYYDIGFRGPIRPDHVPTMAGDSNDHPGYSTIGAQFAFGYMRGLMEGVVKSAARVG